MCASVYFWKGECVARRLCKERRWCACVCVYDVFGRGNALHRGCVRRGVGVHVCACMMCLEGGMRCTEAV